MEESEMREEERVMALNHFRKATHHLKKGVAILRTGSLFRPEETLLTLEDLIQEAWTLMARTSAREHARKHPKAKCWDDIARTRLSHGGAHAASPAPLSR